MTLRNGLLVAAIFTLAAYGGGDVADFNFVVSGNGD
jgi:hypothetical protein